MENHDKEQQVAVNQIYKIAATMMVQEKKSAYETKKALISQGLGEDVATIVVTKLEGQIKEAKNERAQKDMLYGALWCVGGIVVTVATYSAASSGGGRYVVAWGAIIFGLIQFGKGFLNKMA